MREPGRARARGASTEPARARHNGAVSDAHPLTGRFFDSPVPPGTGWPGDPADASIRQADAEEIAELARIEKQLEDKKEKR